MGPEIAAALLIVGLLLLLALGVEIGVAMGVIASISLLFLVDKSLIQIGWTAWESLNSFTLLAMPLFIFMGSILEKERVDAFIFRTTKPRNRLILELNEEV